MIPLLLLMQSYSKISDWKCRQIITILPIADLFDIWNFFLFSPKSWSQQKNNKGNLIQFKCQYCCLFVEKKFYKISFFVCKSVYHQCEWIESNESHSLCVLWRFECFFVSSKIKVLFIFAPCEKERPPYFQTQKTYFIIIIDGDILFLTNKQKIY